MLKQWSGYLRAEKREKTKELYFWTDYVIEHGTSQAGRQGWAFRERGDEGW